MIFCDAIILPRAHNRLGCVGVTVPRSTKKKVGRVFAMNGPNGEAQFFATVFLDKNLTNGKNNQTKTKSERWVGLKIGPTSS